MSGDNYTEVTYTSWTQRLGQAIGGVLIGALLFLVSFPLLFWNEGRAVETARGLAEGQKSVASVPADRVDPANDGKLVHVTGLATTAQTVTDPEFAVSARALRLQRLVFMYQWKEKAETQTQKKLGGGEEKKTTYTYERDWVREPINSANFKVKEGHENPPGKRFADQTQTASPIQLGAFNLPANLTDQITASAPLAVDAAALNRLPSELRDSLKVRDGRFYLGKDPANPQVGDLKIEFQVVNPATVSVIAQQTQDTFRPYATKSGQPIAMLRVGTASAEEMFQAAHSANTVMTWVLRLVGFLLMVFGIALVFRPLVVVADVLPVLGNFVGMGVGLFAFLAAVPLTLVTIAIGWIFYRPLLGIGLLAAALLGFAALFLLRRKRAPAPPRRPVVARAR